MTDREKLIELLSDAPFGVNKQTLKSYLIPEAMADVADHLIANGVTFATDNNVGDKWIPVTERLPEAWTDVLAAYDDKTVSIDAISDNGTWYSSYTSTKDVTHWMPLPEPPKGE